MPDEDPPTPPLRQLVLVYDLTDPRHRAILRSAATSFLAGGQPAIATQIWEHLADSYEPADAEPDDDQAARWTEYFSANEINAWPAHVDQIPELPTPWADALAERGMELNGDDDAA